MKLLKVSLLFFNWVCLFSLLFFQVISVSLSCVPESCWSEEFQKFRKIFPGSASLALWYVLLECRFFRTTWENHFLSGRIYSSSIARHWTQVFQLNEQALTRVLYKTFSAFSSIAVLTNRAPEPLIGSTRIFPSFPEATSGNIIDKIMRSTESCSWVESSWRCILLSS